MRKLTTIYVFAALLGAQTALAQSFEGVITLNTTNEAMKEQATVTWYMKGNSSRLDIHSQAGEYTTDYSVISDEKGMDLVSQGHVTAVPAVAMKMETAQQRFVSETKGQNVNGFACTKQVYTDGDNQTTYWLADDVKVSFKDLPFFIQKNMPQIPVDAFPVKMEKRDGTGKLVLSQDVLSITASPVDAAKFERR